jgi:addiction module HigA family antidote
VERINLQRDGSKAVVYQVPQVRAIVKERRAVTADTAARLARYFGGDAASWLVMQANYDLKTLPTLEEIERDVRAREQYIRMGSAFY